MNMNLMKQLKDVLTEGKEQIFKASEVLAGKLKDVSDESLEISKELFAEISEKTNEIGNATRMKFEIKSLEGELTEKYAYLGNLTCKIFTARQRGLYQKQLTDAAAEIKKYKELIRKRTLEYENLRKKFSGKYLMNKLGDDLEKGEAMIDQIVIKESCSLVNKKLKEIQLPKQALVSAIKRKDEIIIPDGNTRLIAEDVLTIIGKKKDVAKLVQSFCA
jgi:K+/H+ antiporter YhaU regulatory subunit KhtT